MCVFQLAGVKCLPGVRELVRLRPGEGDHHLALTHWILSSNSFAVKTLQKEDVRSKPYKYVKIFMNLIFKSYSPSPPVCKTLQLDRK